MSDILNVYAREILDSRGNPTIEVEVVTENGFMGRVAVPSGASIGTHEARELRDGDKKRYLGKGVLNEVANVNKAIESALIGMTVFEQHGIDRMMIDLDDMPNKGKLGAKAISGVSLAVVKAAAQEARQPFFLYTGGVSTYALPVPLMDIFNRGWQSGNCIDFQDCMVAPVGIDAVKAGFCEYGTYDSILYALLTELGSTVSTQPLLSTISFKL